MSEANCTMESGSFHVLWCNSLRSLHPTVVALVLCGCGSSETPLAAVGPPAPAFTISQDTASVTAATSTTKLVIDRDPFRLRFTDAGGATVLQGSDNTSAAPQPLAAAAEPP